MNGQLEVMTDRKAPRLSCWAALVAYVFTPAPRTSRISAARSQPYDEIAQAPERDAQ